MSSVVELVRSWPLPRVVAFSVIAVSAAACSSESTRFNSNPFASHQESTASVAQPLAPAGSVQTSALPPPSGGQPMPGSGMQTAAMQPPHAQPAYAPPQPAQSPHALPPPILRQTASKGTAAPDSGSVSPMNPW